MFEEADRAELITFRFLGSSSDVDLCTYLRRRSSPRVIFHGKSLSSSLTIGLKADRVQNEKRIKAENAWKQDSCNEIPIERCRYLGDRISTACRIGSAAEQFQPDRVIDGWMALIRCCWSFTGEVIDSRRVQRGEISLIMMGRSTQNRFSQGDLHRYLSIRKLNFFFVCHRVFKW